MLFPWLHIDFKFLTIPHWLFVFFNCFNVHYTNYFLAMCIMFAVFVIKVILFTFD